MENPQFKDALRNLLNIDDQSLIDFMRRYGYTRNTKERVYTRYDVYKFAAEGDIDCVRAALVFGRVLRSGT